MDEKLLSMNHRLLGEDVHKLPAEWVSDVAEYIVENKRQKNVEQLTAREFIDYYLSWNGLLNWTDTLIDLVEKLTAVCITTRRVYTVVRTREVTESVDVLATSEQDAVERANVSFLSWEEISHVLLGTEVQASAEGE